MTMQVADRPPAEAVIVVVPGLSALTLPFSSTVATVSSLLSHVTVLSLALAGTTVAFKVAVPLT